MQMYLPNWRVGEINVFIFKSLVLIVRLDTLSLPASLRLNSLIHNSDMF